MCLRIPTSEQINVECINPIGEGIAPVTKLFIVAGYCLDLLLFPNCAISQFINLSSLADP